MATKFHIQDVVRIHADRHMRRELDLMVGTIVSCSNHSDDDGPYQLVNIDVGRQVVRGINSRNLKRIDA